MEKTCRPLIGSMMKDLSLWLDEKQQETVALWATKTAMVIDAIRDDLFYTRSECERFRLYQSIPNDTQVWMGRIAIKAVGIYGTDFDIFESAETEDVIADGYANTNVIGHLVTQVVSGRARPAYSQAGITFKSRSGQWDQLLTKVWPPKGTANWPPLATLAHRGNGRTSLATLTARWKIGKNISPPNVGSGTA